jgi:ABC-type antimicrobial peptide transport system permease subunit
VLKSIREDEDAVRSLGKNVYSYKMQALVLGGVIGAMAGIMSGLATSNVAPSDFATDTTFFIYTVMLIGGAARVFGPVAGALIFWFFINGLDLFFDKMTSGSNPAIPASIMTSDQASLMRLIFLGLILMLIMFGRSFLVLFMGIGLISWLGMSRVVRGQTLTLKNREFVEAAIATGVKPLAVVFRHIVPNLLGIVVVYTTLLIPEIILLESFISFLGLGIQEPNTSLGALISDGAQTMQYGELWQLGFPLAFFVVILFSFFFAGDGLRDALDPKDR